MEYLKRVQQAGLASIGNRNKARESKHKKNTTSLLDLQLARTPVSDVSVNSSSDTRPNGRSGRGNQRGVMNAELATYSTQEESHAHQAHGNKKAEPMASTAESTSWPNWGSGQVAHLATPANAVPQAGTGAETGAAQKPASERAVMSNNILDEAMPTDKCPPSPERRNSVTLADSRWAAVPLKAVTANIRTASPTVGSEGSTDTNSSSAASDRPLRHGKWFRNKAPAALGHVQSWNGKFQPPPVDWNDRPLHPNDSPEFKDGLNNWIKETYCLVILKDPSKPFASIPHHILQEDSIPDGIGMVPRHFTLSHGTAARYYDKLDRPELTELTKHHRPTTLDELEDDWGKVDLNQPDNIKFHDETTESLVANWNAHRTLPTTAIPPPSPKPVPEALMSLPVPDPETFPKPKISIYLRPAVKSDASALSALYNLHIQHSPRPLESFPIGPADMRQRYTDTRSDNLPFLVASLRTKQRDTVIGFAAANSFSAPDYVDRITAELEVYVHPKYARKGVGRCLLDRLLFTVDNAHAAHFGAYRWHCAPGTLATNYYGGGAGGGFRQLNALVFVVRHWSRPRVHLSPTQAAEAAWERSLRPDVPDFSDVIGEDDFGAWLKPWLCGGEWGFEEQGCLREVATKDGRLIDVSYLVRKTGWRMVEGGVPAFVQGMGAGVVEDDGEEGEGSEED